MVGHVDIKQVRKFKCLESVLTVDEKYDTEIRSDIGAAKDVFGNISKILKMSLEAKKRVAVNTIHSSRRCREKYKQKKCSSMEGKRNVVCDEEVQRKMIQKKRGRRKRKKKKKRVERKYNINVTEENNGGGIGKKEEKERKI